MKRVLLIIAATLCATAGSAAMAQGAPVAPTVVAKPSVQHHHRHHRKAVTARHPKGARSTVV